MRSTGLVPMGFRGLCLPYQAQTERLLRLGAHRHHSARHTGHISKVNPTRHDGNSSDATGPGPKRADTCATSTRRDPAVPFIACIAAV